MYMSIHVLLNLLNSLLKSDKMFNRASYFIVISNSHNTTSFINSIINAGAQMINYIDHVTLTILKIMF